MTRKSISRLARVRIFDAAGGICYLCGLKIHAERGEKWDVEHRKPLWLGGADDESNMSPAHTRCHTPKTGAEAGHRAKCDRIRAAHLGIKRKKSRPLPGTRASGWKHKLDGTWERRT
jgi:5-methylcytosine-specific restriction protein A